jgi:hypothetical protein
MCQELRRTRSTEMLTDDIIKWIKQSSNRRKPFNLNAFRQIYKKELNLANRTRVKPIIPRLLSGFSI